MSYDTLEPGDVDRDGNRYADEDAYNKAQDALAAATTPKQYNCLECGLPSDTAVCSNCEDIWGGDFAEDEAPMKQAFNQNGPF